MNVIEKLQDIRRSINPARAIAYLSDIQAHTRIAELFEHFFPEMYQAAGFNLAESRHELSAAEKTFFELVNEHLFPICLLYTSDAADDLLCVDLGGRRIIKKKKKQITHHTNKINTQD